MKKDMIYDDSFPLQRLERGDRAIISVTHFAPSMVYKKDSKKYGHIPNGEYEAICTDDYKLECKQYPELSGKYCYHYGNKWGCSDGIYAKEMQDDNCINIQDEVNKKSNIAVCIQSGSVPAYDDSIVIKGKFQTFQEGELFEVDETTLSLDFKILYREHTFMEMSNEDFKQYFKMLEE